MGDQTIGGISASRLQQTFAPEAPAPTAATRGAQPANPSSAPSHGPAITVDRSPAPSNSRLFAAPRSPSPSPSPSGTPAHGGAGVPTGHGPAEQPGWATRVGERIPGTHQAVLATEDWARMYNEGEERGGVSGRAQQVFAGIAGSLSVLATPEHVVHTAATLATAALGATLSRASLALEEQSVALTIRTGQAGATALETAASTGAPVNLTQVGRLAQMANATRHMAEAAETGEHLVDVAHVAEFQHAVNERVRGAEH